jgi:hypothetical protein
MRILLFFTSSLAILWSCAPARFVEPLQKGQQVITGHFGGPVAKIPGIGAIPIPFSSVGYGRGLTDQTTVFGNLHLTSLAFGVGQFELGASQKLWSTDRMGLSGQLNTNILIDFYTGANRIWPQLDANYYFKYGRQWKPEQLDKMCNEQLWIPSLQFGHQWIRPKWSYQTEVKILAPLESNENIVVPYPSLLQNRGALGLYFGITYSL